MDAECTRLVNLLGTGERNKISREMLSSLLGVCDRQTREMVENAQHKRIPIANMGGGYFICENSEEMERYVRREQARSNKIDDKCIRLIGTTWF